jgi:hypothetical protein
VVVGDLRIEDEDAPARKVARKQRRWVLAEEVADIRRVRRMAGQSDEQEIDSIVGEARRSAPSGYAGALALS